MGRESISMGTSNPQFGCLFHKMPKKSHPDHIHSLSPCNRFNHPSHPESPAPAASPALSLRL